MFEGHRRQLRQSIGSEVVRPRAQLHEPYLLTLAGITRIPRQMLARDLLP
jgi:hypothetical protein